MKRPSPAEIGGLHLSVLRGPNDDGLWYWRARDAERKTVWTGWASRADAIRALRELAIPAMLCAELGLRPYDAPFGLHGCGMIIVNPPWQFDELLKRLLPELRQRLRSSEQGETRLDWLTLAP